MPATKTDEPVKSDPRLWQDVKSGRLKVVTADDQPGGALFRKEVFLFQSRRLQGEVLIGTGLSWLIIGYAAVAVLVASLLFISLLSYARTETVNGWLVPEGGIIRLGADQGGVVETIFASEGKTVTAGEPLARLRLSLQTTEGDAGKVLEDAVLRQLQAARATAAASTSKIIADRDALLRQKPMLIAQVQQARALLDLLQKKKGLAESKVHRAQTLEGQGYLSAQALDDTTAASLDASQAVVNQRNALLALQQSESDLEAKLIQIPIQLDEAEANARAATATVQQQLEQVRVGHAYTINAPTAGVIMAIPCIQGQSLTNGSTVALMRPVDARLQAELFVPSRSAGFIKVGQEVSLQYQAFSYEKFGSAKARILSISRAPLNPAEVAGFGFNVNEPVFRVRAALDKAYVMAYAAKHPLQAGTALTARVVLDRRTLIEWLFDPLFAVARR